MDANFMNAKEMKYNRRKKENNIHLEERRRSKITYILLRLHPQSSSFHQLDSRTHAKPRCFLPSFTQNHSGVVVDVVEIFLCCCLLCFCYVWKDFGHV